MALGRSQGSRGQAPLRSHLRHRRIHRRHRQARRAGAGSEIAGRWRGAPHRLPCAGAEHGPEGGGNAAPHPRRRSGDRRALLRPWRFLGRAERQFRNRAQGRQAGGAAGPGLRQDLSGLGMPAGRPAYRPGHGESAIGQTGAGGQPAPHRIAGPSLRALELRRTASERCMTMKHEITRADLMPIPEYSKVRKERRQTLVAAQRDRRLHVGRYATFHFENYDSMWHQVHEMLYIEKGGEAQVEDELRAYNSLIPNGRELVATIMFEIDDEKQRRAFLAKLGGVEETVFLRFDGETVRGKAETDVDRTTADGKASSVQIGRAH